MAYKVHYSDYPGTDTGPPDPERWVGPPGPTGPMGPQGVPGPPGPNFPEAPADGPIYGRGGATPVWTPTLPLTGGTVSGPATFSASGMGLAVTNSATFNAGVITVGATTGGFSGLQSTGNINAYMSSGSSFTFRGPNGALAQVVDGTGGSPAADFLKFNAFASGAPSITTNSGTNGITINPGTGTLYIGPSPGPGTMALKTLIVGSNQSYPSSGTTLAHPLNLLANPSGTYAAGGTFGGHNSIAIGGDALASSGGQGISALRVALGSASGIAGTRMAIHADLTVNHSDSLGGGAAHVVLLATGAQAASQGGTSPHTGSSKGSFYGINPNVRLASGATNLSGIYVGEFDIAIPAGASAQEKIGIQIVKTNLDVVQAGDLETDTAFRIADQPSLTIPSWTQGIDFGSWLAQWPFGSASTIIRARPSNGVASGPRGFALKNPLAAIGVDFSRVSFTTASLLMPGFQVSPTGAVLANAATISTTGAVTKIDANLFVAATVAVSAGGSNYYAGDIVTTADGSIVTVSTVSAGVVTGVTLTSRGYAASAPANPVATRDGSGSGLTLTMTWTAANTLALNPSGGTVTAPTATPGTNSTQVATTAFVANAVASGGGASPSALPPAMNGVAAIGVDAGFSRGDHVHPSDTSRLAAAGGTISGTLGVTGLTTLSGGVGGPLTVGTAAQAQLIATPGATTGNAVVLTSSGGGGITVAGVNMVTGGIGAVTFSSTARFNGTVGFNNTAPIAKPSISGSRGGNAALASLLTALANYGLVTDGSSA